MIKNETCGGLRMVKLDNFIKTLKVTWVRRFLLNLQNPIWSSLSNIDFSKLLSMGDGYPTQVIHNLKKPFWIDILLDWSEVFRRIKPENLTQILHSPI